MTPLSRKAGEGQGVRACCLGWHALSEAKGVVSEFATPFASLRDVPPNVMLSEAKHLKSHEAKEILRFAQDDKLKHGGSGIGSTTA